MVGADLRRGKGFGIAGVGVADYGQVVAVRLERTRRLGLPAGRGVPIRTDRGGAIEGPVDLSRIVCDIEAYREENPEDLDYDNFLAEFYHHQGVTLANAGRVVEAYPLWPLPREGYVVPALANTIAA